MKNFFSVLSRVLSSFKPQLKMGNGSFFNVFKTKIHPKSKVEIGKNSMIFGSIQTLKANTTITVGNRCYIGNADLLAANKISIGNDVLIAGKTYISDNDGHSIYFQKRKKDVLNSFRGFKNWEEVKKKEVRISDGVWIGYGCTILKGVTLGRGCVVAAQSVVTKSFPSNCVIAGNPAKIIKYLKQK